MVRLRPTSLDDLDFVLALEHRPGQQQFIGQWTRDEHAAAMARPDRDHWIVEGEPDAARLGYIITYDVRDAGYGIYVKRIAVANTSQGVGRHALHHLAAHAFDHQHAASVCLAVREHNARAQRAYLAVGFVAWTLADAERGDFTRLVDPGSADCLLMRVTPDSLHSPDAAEKA